MRSALVRLGLWIDWQLYDTGVSWTSFTINESQQTATPVKRFYMHAGFCRFIRPGATLIAVNSADMVAAILAVLLHPLH